MCDEQPKCLVPDCFNNVGVLFPKSVDARKKWLAALNLEHLVTNSKSFVCLDHFGEDGQPLAKPSITPEVHEDELQNPVAARNNKSISYNIMSPLEATDFQHQRTYSKKLSANEPATFEKVCRLCMIQSAQVSQYVFAKMDEQFTVAQAIAACLHPITIDPSDDLSKYICLQCYRKLKEYLTFQQVCMIMDLRQRQNLNILNESVVDSDDSIEYLHEERLSDYEDNIEKPRKYWMTNSNQQHDKSNNDLLKVLEGDDEAPKKILTSEGTIVDRSDGEYAESIVIEIVEDEEGLQDSSIDSIIESAKLPITIKRVGRGRPSKRLNASASKTVVSKRQKTSLISDGVNVVLPSGISVDIKEKYQSELGRFDAQVLNYHFDTPLILAGGYSYEKRFSKGHIIRLACIVKSCPAKAHQSYEMDASVVQVITPHNHPAPNDKDRQIQMFYYVMFSKIQGNKSFNFKNVYEQFCKLNPNIPKILPLPLVAKEVCKLPTTDLPVLDNFDDFYQKIENDEFHQLHFTLNKTQFYQDRMETEDGGQAVLFANRSTISQFSSSDLMFVDSSFNLESDTFPFQMITVLVWVDQSYHPILFAFVNMRSRDLYRTIFSYLYNNLAPELRPVEIVTDYEANIYYALSEVYVHSTIGGSLFHFAQNIYKKVCSLDLAKMVESNTNFRNIYYMVLMLPLLPVNTIRDVLKNIEVQAKDLKVKAVMRDLFEYINSEWIDKVTPQLFCVHRLKNRINENIAAPFKKFRELIMLAKSKRRSDKPTIVVALEKLIDLEQFLRQSQKLNGKDVSSSQKKNILRAWDYIENHPMINIYQFFLRVLGYIKCMENQLWIWGLYRFKGHSDDNLIDATSFSMVHKDLFQKDNEADNSEVIEEFYVGATGIVQKVEDVYEGVETIEEVLS